jgi:hypothetical protein
MATTPTTETITTTMANNFHLTDDIDINMPENYNKTTNSNNNNSGSNSPQKLDFSFENDAPLALIDSEFIEIADLKPNMCLISVPFIYVHAKDGVDKIIPNIRAIEYDKLVELISISITIPKLTQEENNNLTHILINGILKTAEPNDVYVFEFIKCIATMAENFGLQEQYFDATNCGISFDVIRTYQTDANGLLVTAEPSNYNGYLFYSQMADNQEEILKARAANNDTDYNRMQYTLVSFERAILFQPGYIYNSTISMINLMLFYFHLCVVSIPIRDHCMADLRANMIGWLVDMIARTRVIHAWQSTPQGQRMLSDIITNYDTNNHNVTLCKLKTARERANFISNILDTLQQAKITQTDAFLKTLPMDTINEQLSFDWYMENVNKTIRVINDEPYYVFNTDFIININTEKLPTIATTFLDACDNEALDQLDLPPVVIDNFTKIKENMQL